MKQSMLSYAVVASVLIGAQRNVAAQADDALPPSPPAVTQGAPDGSTPAQPAPAQPAPTQPAPVQAAPAQPAPAAMPSIFNANAPPPPIDLTRTAKNTLFVELLGNGLFYSLNYERFVTDDIAIRAGLGYFSVGGSSKGSNARASLFSMPIMFEYFGIGSADDKLELGIGPVLFYASASGSFIGDTARSSGTFLWGTATIGYRHAPHDGGFAFKIGFTPIFGKFGFIPYLPGIGAGAEF